VTHGLELSDPLRRLVGEAWAARTHVEEISAVQFGWLAEGLGELGAPARLVEVARRAAADEGRHRGLCADLASAYGVAPGPASEAARLAPAGVAAFEAAVYAAVAHCCVAETESVATLTELVRAAGPAEVRSALVAIAHDEVEHARLGWAVLTWAAQQRPLGFLARWLPAMLEPGAGPLFQGARAGADDERLRAHGVLPAASKRRVFTETFEQVLLPGLERAGVDGASARAWLDEKSAGRSRGNFLARSPR